MPLYVPAEDVLDEVGIDPETATPAQIRVAQRKIEAAQNKVLLFLGRESFAPTVDIRRGLYWDNLYPETDLQAWPETARTFPDRVRYVSHVANTEEPDTFDVTFHVGLDLAGDPGLAPIKEFIIGEAAEGLYGHSTFPTLARRVSSVSAQGQSVSFEKRASSPDEIGGQLTIATLARFKKRAVGQAPGGVLAPWPLGYR